MTDPCESHRNDETGAANISNAADDDVYNAQNAVDRAEAAIERGEDQYLTILGICAAAAVVLGFTGVGLPVGIALAIACTGIEAAVMRAIDTAKDALASAQDALDVAETEADKLNSLHEEAYDQLCECEAQQKQRDSSEPPDPPDEALSDAIKDSTSGMIDVGSIIQDALDMVSEVESDLDDIDSDLDDLQALADEAEDEAEMAPDEQFPLKEEEAPDAIFN
jgi:hypothetical protein